MINDNISKRLFTGTFLRTTVFLVNIAVTFYLTPLIVKTLGDMLYGFWSIIAYFIGYYGILDLGISAAVVRFVSQKQGINDFDEIETIANTSFIVFTLVGLFALILTVFFAIILPSRINSAIDAEIMRNVIFILGCGVAISFPMRIVYGMIIPKLRYDLFSYLEIGQILSRLFLILCFLKAGFGIISLALINVSVDIAGHIVRVFFLRSEYPKLKLDVKKFSFNKLKEMYSYGMWTFASGLADQLKFRTSPFVIAKYTALATVTHYEIGYRLINYYREFVMSAVNMLMPVFSHYEGKNDYGSIRKVYLFSSKISLILTSYLGISLYFYADDFIIRWMGIGYLDSYHVMTIMLIGSIIEHLQFASNNLLLGISKHINYSVINIIEGVVHLILCIVFVKVYGMVGAAWAMSIENVIFRFVILPGFAIRTIGISFMKYYVYSIGYTLLIMIGIIFPIGYFFNKLLIPNYLAILGYGSIQTLIAIPIIFYTILNKTEREMIFSAAKSIIRKSKKKA